MRRTINLRLPEIDSLLLTACFPFVVATCVLAMRRWSHERWRDFRRLWSVHAVLAGMSVLFAFFGWGTIIELATPLGRIAPYLPSFLAVPFWAAGGLCLVGTVLAFPEFIVRVSQAKRRQP